MTAREPPRRPSSLRFAAVNTTLDAMVAKTAARFRQHRDAQGLDVPDAVLETLARIARGYAHDAVTEVDRAQFAAGWRACLAAHGLPSDESGPDEITRPLRTPPERR